MSKVDFDKVNAEIVADIFSDDDKGGELRKKVIKDDQEISGLAGFIGGQKDKESTGDSDIDEEVSNDLQGLGFLSGSDSSAWDSPSGGFSSMFGGPGGLKGRIGGSKFGSGLGSGFGSGGIFGGAGSLF